MNRLRWFAMAAILAMISQGCSARVFPTQRCPMLPIPAEPELESVSGTKLDDGVKMSLAEVEREQANLGKLKQHIRTLREIMEHYNRQVERWEGADR